MPVVPQRVSLITLAVHDVDRSTAFYEALGWERSSASQPSITFLQLGGSALALYGAAALTEDVRIEPAAGAGFRGVTLAINLDSPVAVDRAFARFLAAGGSEVVAPAAASWGGYTSYVADPDGHVWEIAHNPFFPLGDDGSLQLPA